MQLEELEEELTCADCGVDFWPNGEPPYLWGEDGVLCYQCASRRGGRYDAERGTWAIEPNLSALPDERRPHP